MVLSDILARTAATHYLLLKHEPLSVKTDGSTQLGPLAQKPWACSPPCLERLQQQPAAGELDRKKHTK